MIEFSKNAIVALMLTVAALWAAPAGAQELSLGYQAQRFSSEGDNLNVPLGVSVSVAGPSSGPLGLVGQVDWSRKRESETVFGTSVEATANFTAFAGGVRWSGRNTPSATPFVEALVGAMRSSGSASVAGQKVDGDSVTDPMLEFGGGVSIPISGGLGAFGQVDYRRIFADTGINAVRFVVGIRLTAR